MKQVLKSLTISTAIVVGYPIVVFAVLAPFAGLWLTPYQTRLALDALYMPLALPTFIVRSFWPAESITHGRIPIEQTILMLGWFIAFNSVLYYVPIRLILQWREQKTRFP